MVVHVDMAKARMNGLFGLALLALLLAYCFGLSVLLLKAQKDVYEQNLNNQMVVF